MLHTSPIYRFVSILLSALLLIQSVAPALAYPRTAVAQEATSTADALAQPAPLANPLTIVRTQSRYQAGGQVTISYTLHNNLIPTYVPEMGGNITDTVALLTSFDPTEDMNTLHTVVVDTTLPSGVSYVDSTTAPTQNGSQLSWELPAIPPSASHTFTLTVQPPATAADFLSLDSGATATADLWDTAVSATAHPAQLAPSSVPADTLQSTAEVDLFDTDMLWFAADFAQDPTAAFTAVQAMQYEPYHGSLRGTRGTLWSDGGNSLDQASLLIALLRSASIPARYRQGTLTPTQAQAVLASMFPAPTGVAGYLPTGTETADPLNDPALIALAQDHWWVEAYLPNQGWTNLDPTYPNATIGQIVATPGPHDRVAAVPASYQHTLTLSLIIEQYSAFPLGGTFLQQFTPLYGTFPTAQVAGKQVVFGQFVEDSGPAGGVFSTRQIDYQPYFGIVENNSAILGDPFQDILTNFPFGTQATIAAWIQYELHTPNGQTETFQRPIKDLMGADVRLNGGTPDLVIDATNSPPFLTADEQYVHWVLPNAVPEWAYRRRATAVLPQIIDIGQQGQAALDLIPHLGDAYTPEQIDTLTSVAGLYIASQREQLALAGLQLAWQTDSLMADIEAGLRTELFYASPRLFAVGATLQGGQEEGKLVATVDLRTTRATAVVHPGQATRAQHTAQWLKGVLESELEADALEQMGAETAVSTARLFAEMETAGIPPVLFHPEDIDRLDQYPYSAEGKAYMAQALLAGKLVLAPSQHVLIDGEPALAWWQIDPTTGETISVGENGLHPSAAEWTVIRAIAEELIMQIFEFLLNYILGEISGGWLGTPMGPTALAQFIALLTAIGEGLNETFSLLAAAIGGSNRTAAVTSPDLSWAFLPAHLCPVDNCGIEQFILPEAAVSPIPLPDMHFVYLPEMPPTSYAGALVPATVSLPAGAPTAVLTLPASSTTTAGQPTAVQATLTSNFAGQFTTLAYVPEGWEISLSGTGLLVATPPATAAPATYTLLLVTQSTEYRSLVRSAQHTVTVSPSPALALSYTAEPNITVPMGVADFSAVSNQTNDGEAEIPNSAFRLTLTNTTAQAQSLTLSVSGAPAGWLVLNGLRQNSTTFTLPAYSQTEVGLYVAPATVPTPGTSFVMDVQLSSGSGSANASIPWQMANQPFNYLQLEPNTIYITPSGTADIALTQTNVGNGAGSFPIAATLPSNDWSLTPLQSPVALGVGQSVSQTATLTADASAEFGQRYQLLVASPAPSSYTQYALATVQIVSEESGAIFEAANSCPVTPNLGASITALGMAVTELQTWCALGHCPLPLRDRVVTTGQAVQEYAQQAAQPTVLPALVELDTAVSTLATQTENEDILAAVTDLATAVTNLSGNLCTVEQHRATARFTPYVQAILLGETANFSLDVTNHGTLETTYAITVSGLPSGDILFNETIPAGDTLSLPLNPTPNTLGNFNLQAEVVAEVAVDEIEVKTTAVARLNVVDKFVQLTQVLPDPSFVETGVSSTTLSIEVANLAGVALPANAEARLFAPNGNEVAQSNTPLTLLAGNPRTYELGSVDTSGWDEGVYTITVDLLHPDTNTLLPDGSNYGYLSVGQAVQLSQAVSPMLVPPGTLTVTTIITSEIASGALPDTNNQLSDRGNTVYDAPITEADMAYFNTTAVDNPTAPEANQTDLAATLLAAPQFVPTPEPIEQPEETDPFTEEITLPLTPIYETYTDTITDTITDSLPFTIHNSQFTIHNFPPTFTRTEQTDPAWSYTGTWTNLNLAQASGGSYWHNATAGSTAQLTFDGTWLSLGFITNRWGGQAAITIDGTDYGLIDLYRNEETATSFLFDGLPAGSHTVEIEVLGTANPFAVSTRVQLDYADYGDGSLLPDGDFEENDPRLLASNGWSVISYAEASGGSYLRTGTGTAWFPFAGDSFTLHSLAHSSAGKARLFVDGVYLDTIDMFAPVFSSAAITRTFAYEGLGSGPHILQISSYQSQTTIDKLVTPGSGPFIDTNPPLSSVTRFEADHPSLLYNSVPFTQTASSWVRVANANANRASAGEYIRSGTAEDTVTVTFQGDWIDLGFIGDRWSGYAAITIDGDDYGILDLYRNEETPVIYRFDGLPAGSHTLEIEVLGTANPFASNTRVQLDYVDYGDGTLLPDGDFEEDDPRLLASNGWSVTFDAVASGGSYLRTSTGTAWFPFAGDSFTLHSLAHSSAGKARLFVDGVYLDTIDMFAPVFSSAALTRTFAYEGLGSGSHILQIISYQNQTTIDKITTPGSGPFIDPNPPVTGVTRFEEDHPTIRYNGVPFTQTASTWNRIANIFATRASAGQYIYSPTADDTIAFDFEGNWLGIGFATDRFGGQAEIHIDGQLVETADLYSRYEDTASVYFRDLGAGSHTVTITVLGTSDPEAIGTRIYLDFFDVWDGQPLTEGTFEENDERLMLSNGWGRTFDAEASGGAFASSSSNVTAWFPFTGDSFTYHGRTLYTYQDIELRLNGEPLGQFDIYSYENGFRTYSFDNLGAGPHMLEIRQYRDPITVDAVSSPAIEPAWEPPAPAAIVRYEENHPDMRYNGYPYHTMPQSWTLDGTAGWTSSGSNSVYTSLAGNIWSFAFDGEWVNVGLRSSTGGADIRINGVSQGIFDTSGGVNGVKNFPFALDSGTHLVEVEVISGTVSVDYMDVWQGDTIDAGWYDAQLENEETGLFHFSRKAWWRQSDDIYAYNGDFMAPFVNASTNIWFHFVGTDLSILGNQRDGTSLHVVIDGVDYGVFDMSTVAPFRGQPYALHFPDLSEGPHVVQVYPPGSGGISRIDAFEVNPDGFYSYMPEFKWYDTTATEELDPDYGTGFLSTIAIGDLNGDGSVELVAPGLNGRLYVYRGDGADAGDGTPILWTSDLVGRAAEPALADLTGDGNAEIVISGENGTFAFTHEGNLLWHNPDVVSFYTNEELGWGGPSIGNLDLSPEPEIVIATSRDALYVLDHMGNTQWSTPVADRFVTTPVLADITGDGILDIIVADKWDLRVYDYFNGGQLVWEYTQPDQIEQLGGAGAFGAPAVADITGDGEPEIIINWGVFVEALRADGSLLWKYDTGNTSHYRPSPITVADTTGDGQMNIITASAIGGIVILNHTLMVLDADGNLVWEQLVGDRSASASGVSAQDLTGNGVWEVLWNGSSDGFLILRGSDGKRLFNEPYTWTGTVLDYPTLGDVDGDGVADVVMAGRNGLFVISHVGHWVDSRPLWNQHNYHVTNINDDWSVPISEQNSWALHNTYRTQTPERNPSPSYQMVFTYTAGFPDVAVLTETATISMTADHPVYGWEYRQEWYQPVISTTFDSLLTDMQPGETRQVGAGTEVAYRLPSGFNYVTLPPLYVTAERLGSLLPAEQSVAVGSTAVYTLTLSNPTANPATYSLAPGGLPEAWLTYPATVNIGAEDTAVVNITVQTPAGATPDTLPLWVDVDNGQGGTDAFSAQLTLFDGLALSLDPASQAGTTGQPLTYTLTISNLETTSRTYALTATGLAEVSLPSEVTVAGNSAEMVVFTAVPVAQGPQPFNIEAVAVSGATASVDGVATGNGRFGILAEFNPDSVVTGPGATAVVTLTLTNVGDVTDNYALTLDAPAGWDADLTRYGVSVNEAKLASLPFNQANLILLVTPELAAQPGSYPVTVTAQSLTNEGIQATAVVMVEVSERGVTVEISPANQTINPNAPSSWNVTVTNRGSVADSYALTPTGVPALAGTLTEQTGTLAPGASQTVQLSVPPLPFLVAGPYRFAVMAESVGDAQVRAQDTAEFTMSAAPNVLVEWLPPSRTVTDTLTLSLGLVVTNTGNVLTEYALDLTGTGLTAVSTLNTVPLPAGSQAFLLVTVQADGFGEYVLTATAVGDGATASDSATLNFVSSETNVAPVVNAGADIATLHNTAVLFDGSFSDPDGPAPYTIEWDFGDGNTASGSLTPSHSYSTEGVYTVTLTVTDGLGAVGTDTLQVTVSYPVQYLPIIIRTP